MHQIQIHVKIRRLKQSTDFCAHRQTMIARNTMNFVSHLCITENWNFISQFAQNVNRDCVTWPSDLNVLLVCGAASYQLSCLLCIAASPRTFTFAHRSVRPVLGCESTDLCGGTQQELLLINSAEKDSITELRASYCWEQPFYGRIDFSSPRCPGQLSTQVPHPPTQSTEYHNTVHDEC